MKRIFSATLVFILLSASGKAQCWLHNPLPEIDRFDNGMIYDQPTMDKLVHLVDSLHPKFERCELARNYYATSQGMGHYVSMEKGNVRQAVADIKNNISFEDFIKKYNKIAIDRNMLIVRNRYLNYAKKWTVTFTGMAMHDYDPEISVSDTPEFTSEPLVGRWIIYHEEKTQYSSESVDAFYITKEFSSDKIPDKYARMISYADCVIDTSEDMNATSAYDDVQPGSWFEIKADTNAVFAFTSYVWNQQKNITEKNVPAHYEDKYDALDSMRKDWLEKKVVPTEKFRQMMTDALKAVKEKNIKSTNGFEYYVGEYYSKPEAFALRRNRRVIGHCSADPSPRLHAFHIATLAAEASNWPVFVRAHMNLLNDQVERHSDGSWEWDKRRAYVKELESLHIELTDLLFGTTFKIENSSTNHYFGKVYRLGRAMAESKYRSKFEALLDEMIRNNELDLYNRMLMHYAYLSYVRNLPKTANKPASLTKLKDADKQLPLFLSSRIKIKKADIERKPGLLDDYY